MSVRADRDRASPDQAALPVDEQSSRADEPHHQDATVKRYHYASQDELRHHLQLFVDAYNYGRRLKTLRGRTPYEFIYQTWTKEPERFRLDPSHHMPGPNN